MSRPYIADWITTEAGKIPVIPTDLTFRDYLGSVLARCTINRMHYTIEAGLYAAGNPHKDSPVFVTANYKMSFDALRRRLKGIDSWIMVLDTKGINVWCAAGKGTFGTDEILRRIEQTQLHKIINYRKIILPQLGAPGIAAHKVKKSSGFSVVYGPVRAIDIGLFLKNGMTATAAMRTVRFTIIDRIKLIPAEMVVGIKYLLYAGVALLVLSGLHKDGYSYFLALHGAPQLFINTILVYISGTAAAPLLLPWIPGRSFSVKGFFVGAGMFSIAYFLGLTGTGIVEKISWLFLYSGISSFMTMNFTGSSTYTSLSGVIKEMHYALPVQIGAAVIGIGFWITSLFL